jgi:hypothetical protein
VVQKHSASGMCTISSPCQPAQKCLKQQHRSQRTRCFVAAHASNGSAANGASSLLKLSIPFATEFGDSVAVTTSTSGWSVEEVQHVACCCEQSHVVKNLHSKSLFKDSLMPPLPVDPLLRLCH